MVAKSAIQAASGKKRSKRSKACFWILSKLLKRWSGRRGSNPRRPAWEQVGWMCLQQLSVSGALYRLTASLAISAFSSLTPSNRGFFEVQSHCHSYLDLRGIPWHSQPGLHRPGRQPWESTVPRSFSPPADRRRSSGMASAAEILQFEHADFLVSKQKLERAKGIEVVRIKREQRTQDLCFSSRPFVLCGLPVRRLPKDQLLYERRNGKFVLQITGHPDFGVPVRAGPTGSDLSWRPWPSSRRARRSDSGLRPRCWRASGCTLAERSIGGWSARLSGSSARRSSSARIASPVKATMVQRSRFNFMREAQIWYSREHPDQRTLSSEFENVIVLSDEFYQELIAHPVPNDLEAIKVLAASPAVLDLFMWLSYRCFTAKGTESIPLFGDFGLANQIGTTDYSRPRRFRAMVEQWLDSIRALWPECPARISSDGQSIIVKHASAVLPAESVGL